MGRRRALAAAIVVVAAAVAIVAVGLREDGGERGTSSRGRVVEPDPDFAVGHHDSPYRIVYRLDDLSDDDVEPSTDEVWVRPPFESRLETSSGAPPGDELQGVQIATIDRLRLGTLDQPLVIARVPGLAVSDIRVAPVLDDGVDAGLLERREQRIVADRRCQVVRSGTLLGAGPLVPITPVEHADSCIDADGLLLEEVLFQEGEPTLHRIAVEVDTEPRLAPDLFEAGEITLPADEGGGSSRPVDPATGSHGAFWIMPAGELPTGFDHVGRFAIVPPQTERFAGAGRAGVVAGTADVFARAGDFVVIYQGGTLGGVDAFSPTPDAPALEGGGLGDGELVLGALGSELRFPQRRGRFVHVVGTVAPDDLLGWARSLTETEGTGLVYLDD